jgi:hypothetical protein
MKKNTYYTILKSVTLTIVLFLLSYSIKAQNNTKPVASFPDDVNKIISGSCFGCHSEKGGKLSKSKLNFSDWANYSPEKQKDKVKKMYTMMEKKKMPPKSAREKHPEIIPTPEQVAVIKSWSASYTPDKK